jgi:two-component system CheB/CheR fusion protein
MDKERSVVIRTGVAAARPRTVARVGPGRETVTVLPELDTRHVLIVDDDADTADSLALLVELWGHVVRVARSGDDAMAMALAHRPDVLLLDVAMPGMDGFRLARLIRRQPCLDGVLLVAITGYADDAHRRLGKRAGFDRYLAKPVEPGVVEALLLQPARAFLESSPSAPGAPPRRTSVTTVSYVD